MGTTRLYNISFEDKPFGVYARASNIVINSPQLIDNGYRARFSGSFKVQMSSESDFVIITDTVGPFNASVVGDGGDF